MTSVPFGISAPTGSATLPLSVTTLSSPSKPGRATPFGHVMARTLTSCPITLPASSRMPAVKVCSVASKVPAAWTILPALSRTAAASTVPAGKVSFWFRTTSTGRRVLARKLRALTGTS
ncbi:hypothetical protein D3C87_1228260 [compost metagenome]